jgi:hypothetical protein
MSVLAKFKILHENSDMGIMVGCGLDGGGIRV